ncbi:unnamed protein product [Brassica oleracea var. botrytis]
MLHTYMSMETRLKKPTFGLVFFVFSLLFCAGTTGSSCFRLLVCLIHRFFHQSFIVAVFCIVIIQFLSILLLREVLVYSIVFFFFEHKLTFIRT